MDTIQQITNKQHQRSTSNKKIQHRSFPVLGLSCASCASSVQSMLAGQQGVSKAAVNYANATAHVDYDPTLIQEKALQEVIRSIGYDLVLEKEDAAMEVVEKAEKGQYRKLKTATLFAGVCSALLMILSMGAMDLPYANLITWLLATPVVFLFGRRFFISAYKQLLHGKAGMDTLVALSTGVAYLYSLTVLLFPEFWTAKGLPGHLYFESAAVVITFILLGKLLEMRAKGRTSADIKKLMGTQPVTATRLINGSQEMVAVSSIVAGDHLLVRPGEAIAVDGAILSGQPLINESMITGEPIAVLKTQNDLVYAGTLNENTPFEMTATKVGSSTVLASIIQLVKEAQGSKAPIQQLVDKIAARFVVGVLLIAVITFLCWWIIGGTTEISRGIIAVVTVLVIACPCALGLATPAAIMVGIGRGASMGILIKDAAHLQKLAGVTDIVLDKTGTLTTGKPTVQSAVWLDKNPALPALLSTIENSSQHPLASAVVAYANTLSNSKAQEAASANLAEDVTDNNVINNMHKQVVHARFLPGLGIEGKIENVTYYVGNERLLKEKGIAINTASFKEILTDHLDATIIYFAKGTEQSRGSNNALLAVLALSDPLKSTAPAALARLRAQHIDIHMLTGDNKATAAAIADQTGIKSYHADLLPADKLMYIKDLQKQGKTVAMIGDGINDSAALAGADISIAMSKGSAVAMDVAGMTLMGDNLAKIPDGIGLSRLTNKTIKENLFWAFFYNLIGIPIAAGILYPFTGFMLNPMIAGGAMAMSSICVLAASLRLRYRQLS